MRTLFLIGITLISLFTLSACQPETPANRFTGYIEADLIYVSAAQPGRVLTLPFDQGDLVTAGDLMLTLDNDAQKIAILQARAQLAQAIANEQNLLTGLRKEEINSLNAQLTEAKASLKLAKAQKQRLESLIKIGATTQANKDQIDAEYNVAIARVSVFESQIAAAQLPARPHQIEAAQALVTAAQESLNYALWQETQRQVYAPADARVEQVMYRTGEFVGAGLPIVALLPSNGLKVKFFVPEALLSSITMGQSIRVMNPNTDADTPYEDATVSFIAKNAEFTPPIIYSSESRKKLVFMIEARFARPVALRPGQPVDVTLL